MRCLTYAMRFTGRATPVSAAGSVLRAATLASSSILTANVGHDGLTGDLQSAVGGEAAFASEVTLTGETSFQEVGTKPRHRLVTLPHSG
jgi:hypothetical protein